MALRYQVDSLDDVDRAFHDLYEEAEDGTFRLQIEGVRPESDYEEIRRKLRTAEKEAKKLASQFDPYKNLGSPDEIGAKLAEIETLREQLQAAGGGKRDEIEAQLRKQFDREWGEKYKGLETQLADMRTKAEKAERELARKEVTKDARALAKKLGVTDDWLDVLVDERVESGKIGRDDDGDLVFLKGEAIAGTFEDFITNEIKARPVITGEHGGGGAQGGGKVRIGGKRVVDADDPVALGRNAEDVASGKALAK